MTDIPDRDDSPEGDLLLKCEVTKVDASLGVVFGYGIVSRVNGEPYFDLQGDHVTERAVVKAALKYMERGAMKVMHEGEAVGTCVAFPLTTEVAKALFDGMVPPKTGMLLMAHPNPETFKLFKAGTLTGFSLGGRWVRRRALASPDGRCLKCGSAYGTNKACSSCQGEELSAEYKEP